jgi:hypothetical protein
MLRRRLTGAAQRRPAVVETFALDGEDLDQRDAEAHSSESAGLPYRSAIVL